MEVSAQAAQIFDVAALVEYARFPEQPGPEYTTLIQQVRHWVCILMGGGQRVVEEEGKAGMCKVGLVTVTHLYLIGCTGCLYIDSYVCQTHSLNWAALANLPKITATWSHS